jgi:gliding motility-associated-like protein
MVLSCLVVEAQTPQWVVSAGGPNGSDYIRVCRIAPNGNIYVAGRFTDTIDLDPSPDTHTLISNGHEDLFLAAYTPTGRFLWGFGTGGPDNDNVYDLAIDSSGSAYITGYFKGANIDFDPSASTAYLSDNGLVPGLVSYGGDIFLAKYSSTGGFLWHYGMGGTTVGDLGESVCVDKAGNVYVGGQFNGLMDIDPSSNTVNLDGSTGRAFIVKYTPSGQLIKGINFGGSSTDHAVWCLKSNPDGYIYAAGTFGGISSDFDPSPTATFPMSASGLYDAFFVKYDTALNFQFAVSMGGNDIEECFNIEFDSLNNIYVSGSTTSPAIDFTGINKIIPGSGENMFLAKYSQGGQCLWANVFGGPGNDKARMLLKKDLIYMTGYFTGTIDFDPSPATANLVSHGSADMLIATYRLDGSYVCAFNLGSPDGEQGNALAIDSKGYIYLAGDFFAQTDFDPTGNIPLVKASNGKRDMFLAKYYWPSGGTLPDGYLIGDTVCRGEQAWLRFIATVGYGPFTITWSDGVNIYTKANIESGETFTVSPNPQSTTTYVLLSITVTDICNAITNIVKREAVVYIPEPNTVITKSNDIDCSRSSSTLHVSGGTPVAWTPPDQLAITNEFDAEVRPTVNTVYTVTTKDKYGCTNSADITVNVSPLKGTHVFFPDAFSPNGDGANDCFRVRCNAPVSRYQLSIYNRWGERVFYAIDPHDCWDGMYKGTLQNTGTFFYYYDLYSKECGEVHDKGNVHLIR